MKVHQVGHKLREQIHHFSGKLCFGFGKVASRFVEEMIYGIQARGSVRLSEIGRALDEKITLKKLVDRLSRNLDGAGLSNVISESVMDEGSLRIRKNTLLIVDPSDLTKKYAKKMEHLSMVRDGSQKEIGWGYWLNVVVGAEIGGAEIVPLVHELYSSEAPDFVSENHQILEASRRLRRAASGLGIFVLDRGGDRGNIYREYLETGSYRFIIRQRGDRDVLYRRVKMEMLSLAEACPLPYRETVVKEKDGQEVIYPLQFGYVPVRLPAHPKKKLWLVVVKGFGQKPLMLLTTEPMRRSRKVIWRVVAAYITRWRVEETIRFIKSSYDLEDIRVLTYRRLKNMAALVLAAAFFAAVHLGLKIKMEVLAMHVMDAAKRIFGIPNFRYYALADGIREILTRTARGIAHKQRKYPNRPEGQIPLFIT